VDIDRETLDERIAARVAAMYDGGLGDEVAALTATWGELGRTAATAIGYREAVAHLRGELTLEEARERTTVATRRFARKQDAWFRKDPRVRWVRADDLDRVERAVAAVRGSSR
jgi:tRNA dimethylallyltransferase